MTGRPRKWLRNRRARRVSPSLFVRLWNRAIGWPPPRPEHKRQRARWRRLEKREVPA